MHFDAREDARAANHDAIRASGALLVLGEDGGRETLVELGVALAHGLPVVWLEGDARLPLSATCASVCTGVRALDGALALLEERARAAA